jgi:formimidoylglutamate deiminase
MTRALEIPAMPNVHSHAFQRGLRGVGERPAPQAHAHDDFWSWRESMYELAGRLDPVVMHELGLRVYAEMAAAGYGAVGEFHYVHHQPDGTPYEDTNEMAKALALAAEQCGRASAASAIRQWRPSWRGWRSCAAGRRRVRA